jgi:two-component system phosphate regulon sensor histidine kinase PhoR
MLGCDAEASRGRLLHEVVLNARLHRFVAESLNDPATPPTEFSIDPHGQTTIEADSEQLISADGRPRGLLVILSDVTRLRRLESLRSDFAANVSHELRTPITNIKGYVETMLDVGFDDEEQARRFLEIVNRNSNRLAAIIDDVMTLTKLEQPHARDTLEKTLRPLGHVVRAVAAQFERHAEAKRITIRIDVPDTLRLVIHGPLIEQALGNLVSNAINYSPANTVVSISTAERNGHVEIAVADQGPGIARKHQERLFERFYRVDKARSREVGGTGLGLALVKHIALAHGGNVVVDSELGRGSVFTLILPG